MQLNNNDLNNFHRKKADEISKAASILGSIKSEKKAKASKENGKLGGRKKRGSHVTNVNDLSAS